MFGCLGYNIYVDIGQGKAKKSRTSLPCSRIQHGGHHIATHGVFLLGLLGLFFGTGAASCAGVLQVLREGVHRSCLLCSPEYYLARSPS